ncbi:MAG: beta strand repeat-containing protein, partial [Prochlorotrichaceae cyanobacterium]
VDETSVVNASTSPLDRSLLPGLPDSPIPPLALAGRVIVWADDKTRFLGRLRNPAGFAEISGKNELDLGQGWVDRLQVGDLLLDPTNITIQAGTTGGIGGSPVTTNTLGSVDISNFLITGSLSIATTSGGADPGDITVNAGAAITWNSANSLTLQADRHITFSAGATINGSGNLTFTAGQSGTGDLTLQGTIDGRVNVFLNSPGTTTIAGAIGSINPVASLTTDAPGSTVLAANITAAAALGETYQISSTPGTAPNNYQISGTITTDGLQNTSLALVNLLDWDLTIQNLTSTTSANLLKSNSSFTGFYANGQRFFASGGSLQVAGSPVVAGGQLIISFRDNTGTICGNCSWGFADNSSGSGVADAQEQVGGGSLGGGTAVNRAQLPATYVVGTLISGAASGNITFNDGLTIATDSTVAANQSTITVNNSVSMGTNNLTLQAQNITLATANADITSSSGDITLEADRSITLNSGSSITTTTSGNITLEANTTGTAIGSFKGILLNGAILSTTSGAINLTGIGGDTGGVNHGIYQIGNSQVSTTTGEITYVGTSGVGTAGDNDGIRTEGASTFIRSQDGNINLTGISQGVIGGFNDGVLIHLNSTVETTGVGSITIDGSSTGLGGADRAVFTTGGTTIRTGTGNISLTGQDANVGVTGLLLDTTTLGSATTGNVSLIANIQSLTGTTPVGTGNFTIAPFTANSTFTPTLGNIPSGFSSVTIGNATTGTVNFTNSLTLGSPTTVLGTTIDLASGVALNSGTNNLTFTANRNIILNPDSSITSTSGDITLTALGQVGGNLNGVDIFGATVESDSGDITMTGRAPDGGDGGWQAGVMIRGDGTTANPALVKSSTGTIILEGTGGNGAGADVGLMVWGASGANALVESQDGSISLTGTGLGGGNSWKHGLYLANGTVRTTGTGNINFAGTPGYPGSYNDGYGLYFDYTSLVEATGSGDITLNSFRDIYINTTTFNLGTGDFSLDATNPILSTLPTTIQFYNSTAQTSGAGSI